MWPHSPMMSMLPGRTVVARLDLPIRVSEVINGLFLMLMIVILRAWPNRNMKRPLLALLVCLMCSILL